MTEHEQIANNFSRVRIMTANGQPIDLWYSYNTLIAYEYQNDLTISKNAWSSTTGKHLDFIDPDKSKRIPYHDFTDKYTNDIEARITLA